MRRGSSSRVKQSTPTTPTIRRYDREVYRGIIFDEEITVGKMEWAVALPPDRAFVLSAAPARAEDSWKTPAKHIGGPGSHI
jgi:hypothetical protein